jgi:hypothetical protein
MPVITAPDRQGRRSLAMATMAGSRVPAGTALGYLCHRLASQPHLVVQADPTVGLTNRHLD